MFDVLPDKIHWLPLLAASVDCGWVEVQRPVVDWQECASRELFQLPCPM